MDPADTVRPRAPLLPIFLIVLVDILGYTIILPLLPFYSEHLGASPTVVGLITASYAACQLVAGPLLGAMSDRTGRKPLLIVSQAGTLGGFLLLAFSTQLWMVFLARIIDGLTAGNLTLAQAYISDVTEPKDRAKSFGVIGVAFGIGFLVGPAIAGLLAGPHNEHIHRPLFAAAALSLTSILCTTFLLPNVRARGDAPLPDGAPAPPAGKRLGILQWASYVDYFKRPGLASLLVQFLLFGLMFSTFVGGFAMFAERRYVWHGEPFGTRQVGYVFAYVGFLGIILQGGLIGRLVKRFGEERLIIAGFASTVIGYGLLPLTSALWQLLAAATVSSFGNGVLRPSLTSLITQRTGRREQGVVLGLTQSLTSVAMITAPLLAGLLIDHRQLAAWAWVAAGFSLLGIVVAVRARSRPAAAAT